MQNERLDDINELIENLEHLRVQLRTDSPARYERIGWADRPLRELIDRCREEQERQSLQEQRDGELARLWEVAT